MGRREGIGALDDPAKGEEGDSSENGCAPGARVPPAVLSGGVPPLLSERCRVRIRCVRRIRVSVFATRELVLAVSAGIAGDFI